jgi:hypothetical protein
MEIRPRTRLQLRRAVLTAALGALVVPATAGAAVKTPVIKKVTPKNVNVGETLTIHGKNFRSGKAKNTVLFKRDKGKALFVKAGLATKKKIMVSIPKSLEKYMAVKDGKPTATRFRLRVLTTKLSKSFTAVKSSPTVGPEQVKPADGAGGGGGVTVTLDPNADNDADGLTNAFEEGVVKTSPTSADTDGDGATDGYEYASAVDLNNDDYRRPTASLPYPGKRPYPNPLDDTDAKLDHDGDALTLVEEYELWRFTGGTSLQGLSYSAGLKYSVHTGGNGTARVPALAAAGYDKQAQFEAWLATSGYATVDLPDESGVNFFDVNRDGAIRSAPSGSFVHSETSYYDFHGKAAYWFSEDGWLSDDERDEDADGLSNYDELRGQMTSDWWKGQYPAETPYPIVYAGTSPTDADSDGDGVRDAADDQDHDDVPNFHELSRNMISGRWDAKDANLETRPLTDHGRVNPFNPCLPFDYSRTCPVSIPFSGAWAPFHTNKLNYFVWN